MREAQLILKKTKFRALCIVSCVAVSQHDAPAAWIQGRVL
jgi:hypothetical protein